MAVGEKRSVVMGAEKAAPNGVATLGADGKLVEDQRPDATGMGAADRSLSNLTDPQTALYNLGSRPNRNLLDNWYFVGGGSQLGGNTFPINQRGLTSYTGAVYGIDRWKGVYGAETVQLLPDKIQILVSGNQAVRQMVEIPPVLSGQKATLSILWALQGDYANCGCLNSDASRLLGNIGIEKSFSCQLNSVTFDVPEDETSISVNISGQGTIAVFAVKLELGQHQTLAYQDSGGVWQLLDLPDFTAELTNCHRYYWDSGYVLENPCTGIAIETWLIAASVSFPQEMRIPPTVKLYNIETANQIREIKGSIPLNLPEDVYIATTKYGISFFYKVGEINATPGQAYDFRVVANAEL